MAAWTPENTRWNDAENEADRLPDAPWVSGSYVWDEEDCAAVPAFVDRELDAAVCEFERAVFVEIFRAEQNLGVILDRALLPGWAA